MKKIFLLAMTFCCLFVLVLGCDLFSEEQAPAPVQPPPAPVQPTPLPVAEPPPAPQPPATPLAAVEKETKSSGGGGSIDKPLPGNKTNGDELLGNYTCKLQSKDLPFGLQPPGTGCRIFRDGKDNLRIGPTDRDSGLQGNIQDTKTSGFFVVGKYEMVGNTLSIKARMKKKGAKKYSGNGRGRLNDSKGKQQINYMLIMTKK